MQNLKESNKAKKKELRCPFDKDLKCEDCRLYQPYTGGKGERRCVFLRMNIE